MSGQDATPARPLSPWAKEYGASWKSSVFRDGADHSLLNPIFPRLDPVLYDDLPGGDDVAQPDLDTLLYSQQTQLTDLGGIFSYQLGPLNENLGTVRGGHSATYDRVRNRDRHREKLLQVEEGTWFEFLGRPHWWYLDGDVLIDERLDDPIRLWDPQRSDRIWSELRIVLEFCNRTLVKLLEERDPW
ncbi:hypothetical protein PG985_001491 [Apiospora marii]|uniref:uncharacterized protein n=1 Tax=Apiospora marii TaxID=335849 RepID=UPI0031300FFB